MPNENFLSTSETLSFCQMIINITIIGTLALKTTSRIEKSDAMKNY